MATQKLNIDIVAKDRSKRALQGLQGSLGKLKASVFNLRNAFIGLGAGLVIRNIVNTGKQIENLKVQLKFLFGSAEEGAKAFDKMAKFASKVPFSLEEIQKGSGVLAVVSDDAEELAHLMEITGNVAAVTGLDFKTTAEQIQRSMSAGISAADLFRDKGVKAMLGFKAGATVSIEETVKAFDRVFSKGGKFGNATKELAKTFEGTLSMIGDKVFNFKKVLLEAGFFAELKNQFGDLNKFLEDNSKQIDAIATKMGRTLGNAVAGIANNMKKVKDNIHGFRIAIEVLISLNVVIFLTNVAKALMLVAKSSVLLGIGMSATKKGIFGVVAGGVLLTGVFKGVDKLFENLLKDIEELSKWQHTFGGNPFEKTRQGIVVLSDEAKKLSDEFDKAFNANRITRSHNAMHEFMNKTKEAGKTFKEAFAENELNRSHDAMQKMMNDTTGTLEKQKTTFEQIGEQIKKNNEEFSLSGEIFSTLQSFTSSFSRSLAEALVYGKSLNKSFKELARGLLVDILAKMIERIILLGIEKLIIEKLFKQDTKRLDMEKNITAEKRKQVYWQTLLLALTGGASFFGLGGSAKQHGGAVSKGRPVLVGERGPELFYPNTTGQITQNARGTGGGPVNVNFSITALDASGFSEMLIQNRGTISHIINQAVNERGASNIV